MYQILVPILRYALQAGAGFIAASGWLPAPLADWLQGAVTDEVAAQLVGGLMFLGTTAWYYIERWQGRRKGRKEIADAIEGISRSTDGGAADERLSRNGQLRD